MKRFASQSKRHSVVSPVSYIEPQARNNGQETIIRVINNVTWQRVTDSQGRTEWTIISFDSPKIVEKKIEVESASDPFAKKSVAGDLMIAPVEVRLQHASKIEDSHDDDRQPEIELENKFLLITLEESTNRTPSKVSLAMNDELKPKLPGQIMPVITHHLQLDADVTSPWLTGRHVYPETFNLNRAFEISQLLNGMMMMAGILSYWHVGTHTKTPWSTKRQPVGQTLNYSPKPYPADALLASTASLNCLVSNVRPRLPIKSTRLLITNALGLTTRAGVRKPKGI